MLRIIAGKFKSLQIDQPPLEITRPTTDKVRESIFNIIQNEVNHSIVLDCFGGSGAMSIEAISRGATKAICVEKNASAFSTIMANIEKINIKNIEVHNGDVIKFLKEKENIEFDLIFMDPPYSMELNQVYEIFNLIVEKNFLKKYGSIIYETSINMEQIQLPKKMMISSEKEYGNTKIYIIKHIV